MLTRHTHSEWITAHILNLQIRSRSGHRAFRPPETYLCLLMYLLVYSDAGRLRLACPSAFMYLYYGLAGLRVRLCKPYYITTMQISQMVVGVAVCVAGGYYITKGEGPWQCRVSSCAGASMLQHTLSPNSRYRPRCERRVPLLPIGGTLLPPCRQGSAACNGEWWPCLQRKQG